METLHYEAPEMRLLGIESTPPICLSGDSGTEKVGRSGSSLNDSDVVMLY